MPRMPKTPAIPNSLYVYCTVISRFSFLSSCSRTCCCAAPLQRGSSLDLHAAATDLRLRPLKGKVEGKHTGQNIYVRSFAGPSPTHGLTAANGSLKVR